MDRVEEEENPDDEEGSEIEPQVALQSDAVSGGGEDDEEDTDDQSELVVLDPAHPLMQRVQAALKAQLLRQNEKLEIELHEKMETLKSLRGDRENMGIELYGIQQQLARQQMLVEQEQDKQTTLSLLRKHKHETLAQVRELYKNMQNQVEEERKQTIQLRRDVENVTARLHYMKEAKNTVKDDIALTKRATEKTAADVGRAQEEKQKQDLFLDHLTSRIHELDEQTALYGAQHKAQVQETKAVKEALTEASMELETVHLEKKKLLQQWNNSLIGMRRRDEAYSAMVTAVNMQRQQLQSLETEVDNYKRNITKEQERNEGLTMMLNKVEADIAHIKGQIEASEAKLEVLKTEYTTYTRMLQETEQSLAKAITDCTLKRNELGAIRTQIEREAEEKRKLEYKIMEKMMQRLTMDKATQYTSKAVEKVRKRIEELDINVADVENEISHTQLQKLHVTSRLKGLQQSLDEMNVSMHQQNELISKSEGLITRNNALIERKQTQIDQINKKIDHKLSSMDGGEDLGPLEQKIEGVQKQISVSVDQCNQMQQFWLRQQNELVRKTRSNDDQTQSVNSLKKQLLILEQKKMRTNAQLEQEEKERSQVEHSISSLQKDMVRLSALITEKRGQQEKLEQGNIIMENDFIHALKEAELESIQLQSKVDQLKEENERILNSLVESEYQIMLWEKKIQIACEMKEAVDSDVGQSEIHAMKAEIHRMQVRHDQLMRQQEKMIQDMEKAIYRREAMILRGEAQAKSGRKDQTQGQLKKKLADVQCQLKQTIQDTEMCEEHSQELHLVQQSISMELGEKQSLCQRLKSTMDTMAAQLVQAEETKKQAVADLLSSQAKVKYLNAAKDGKYRMLSKSNEARETEWQRQEEKLHSIQAIVERLEEDYPANESQLRPLSLAIKSRLAQAASIKPHNLVEVA